MSTSSRHRLTSLALIFAASYLFPRELAGAMTSADYAAESIKLLHALFPDLKYVNVEMSYDSNLGESDGANVIDVRFRKHRDSSGHEIPYEKREVLFDTALTFNVKMQLLFDLRNWGPFIDDRRDEFAKQVDAHPEWTDAQIVAALKAAGAKFGPDNRTAFLRTLPLKTLEPLTGPLELLSAKFGVRFDPTGDEDRGQADLMWGVDTRWHSRDGRYEAHYFMTFEPFNGRLRHLDFRWLRPVRR